MSSRLQFRILKGSDGEDADLESMSLEVSNAFITLLKSVTKIAEMTSSDFKIQVKKGSVELIVKGDDIGILETDFNEILDDNSSKKPLVEEWRKIHSLFHANGLTYEADFYSNEEVKIPVYFNLKQKTKLRAKVQKVNAPPIKTNIIFLQGRLISAGGKSPNLHIEIPGQPKMIVNCNESNAKRAINYLYSEITFSALTVIKETKTEYLFCDSYSSKQTEIFEEFKDFIDKMNSADNEIESLRLLHYQCRKYLDEKDYINYRKFLRLFNNEYADVNVINTILIVTQAFKSHEILGTQYSELNSLLDTQLQKLKRN